MTQTKAVNPALKIIVIVAVALLVLLGAYLAGNLILPSQIKSNHQSKNCEQVLTLNDIYANIYPAFMADKSITELTKECALYSVAAEAEQKKSWQSAYNAYQSYKQNYPKGIFVHEADDHGAAILIAQAKEQLTAKQYAESIQNITLVLSNFAATSAATEAPGMMANVYIAWAKNQQQTSDFTGAESTLKTFAAWADTAKKSEYAKSAQRELAQTYLAWGLAFQAQKKFEDARTKFELVISTDPEPLAQAGPAMQAKTAKMALYTEWGDTLMAKNDFAGALDRYQTVVSLSEDKDQPAAKEHVADVYLKWAANLRTTEDFLGALSKIDDAAKNTASETGKKAIETAKAETYTAFSKSTGAQAAQAMKDAIKDVCVKNKKPALPIFGLDKEHILAGIYGIDDKLPENVAATTPGTLHYVACIDMKTQTLQSTKVLWATFAREQYSWDTTLRPINNPEATTQTTIQGGTPPPLPQLTYANFRDYLLGGTFYRSRGSNPDPVELANWLLTVMK